MVEWLTFDLVVHALMNSGNDQISCLPTPIEGQIGTYGTECEV